MSGHSKWSKVKRQKGITDMQKGRVFAKLSKLITLSVVEGGGIGDPEHNVKLRLMIEKARQDNMPKENIERAIEKASGNNKDALREVHYEAFAKGGVAILIIATTDNPNRTTSEIKNVLDRHGSKLGAQGSVSYLFQHCMIAVLNKSQNTEEKIYEFAESMSAIDIEEEGERFIVYIPFQNAGKLKNNSSNVVIESHEIEYKPTTVIEASKEHEQSIIELIEALENLDDVQNVYTNCTFTTL